MDFTFDTAVKLLQRVTPVNTHACEHCNYGVAIERSSWLCCVHTYGLSITIICFIFFCYRISISSACGKQFIVWFRAPCGAVPPFNHVSLLFSGNRKQIRIFHDIFLHITGRSLAIMFVRLNAASFGIASAELFRSTVQFIWVSVKTNRESIFQL